MGWTYLFALFANHVLVSRVKVNGAKQSKWICLAPTHSQNHPTAFPRLSFRGHHHHHHHWSLAQSLLALLPTTLSSSSSSPSSPLYTHFQMFVLTALLVLLQVSFPYINSCCP